MSNKFISIPEFRSVAHAALMEVELNALKGREDHKMQDALWEQFKILEEIAESAQRSQANSGPLQGEVVE